MFCLLLFWRYSFNYFEFFFSFCFPLFLILATTIIHIMNVFFWFFFLPFLFLCNIININIPLFLLSTSFAMSTMLVVLESRFNLGFPVCLLFCLKSVFEFITWIRMKFFLFWLVSFYLISLWYFYIHIHLKLWYVFGVNLQVYRIIVLIMWTHSNVQTFLFSLFSKNPLRLCLIYQQILNQLDLMLTVLTEVIIAVDTFLLDVQCTIIVFFFFFFFVFFLSMSSLLLLLIVLLQ